MKNKFNSLTGLRFIAASMVFLSHAKGQTAPQDWPFINWGTNAVTLFFTLSGFVICYSYFVKFAVSYKKTFANYLVARFARIYPLHYLVLLVAIFLNFHPDPVAIPFNLTLTQSWFWLDPLVSSYNNVAWSLSVEVFLYLAFPIVIFPYLRRVTSIKFLILSGFLGYSIMILWVLFINRNLDGSIFQPPSMLTFEFSYYSPLPHLSEFFFGCIVARLVIISAQSQSQSQSQEPTLLNIKQASFICLVCVSVVVIFIYQPGVPLLKNGNLDGPFYAFLIYYLVCYKSRVNILLGSRIMVILGEASFSIYLIHYIPLSELNTVFPMNYSMWQTWVLIFTLFSAISALAVIINRVFENPVRKLLVNTTFRIKSSFVRMSLNLSLNWLKTKLKEFI